MSSKQSPKVKLICNECGKKRLVSVNGNYNDRCPKCGGVDWDVTEELAALPRMTVGSFGTKGSAKAWIAPMVFSMFIK